MQKIGRKTVLDQDQEIIPHQVGDGIANQAGHLVEFGAAGVAFTVNQQGEMPQGDAQVRADFLP